MPAFLENKLKQQYGQDSDIPYKIMNKMGVMSGPNETAKGKAMARKYKADQLKKAKRRKGGRGDRYPDS